MRHATATIIRDGIFERNYCSTPGTDFGSGYSACELEPEHFYQFGTKFGYCYGVSSLDSKSVYLRQFQRTLGIFFPTIKFFPLINQKRIQRTDSVITNTIRTLYSAPAVHRPRAFNRRSFCDGSLQTRGPNGKTCEFCKYRILSRRVVVLVNGPGQTTRTDKKLKKKKKF